MAYWDYCSEQGFQQLRASTSPPRTLLHVQRFAHRATSLFSLWRAKQLCRNRVAFHPWLPLPRCPQSRPEVRD